MEVTLKPKRAMIRKQVFITTEQNARLKGLAATSGRAEGALVREGIDKLLAEQSAAVGTWKEELGKLKGMWAGRNDLDGHFEHRRQLRRERRVHMNELMKRGDDT